MSKDWRELTTDEVLNFDGPQTAEIARYERIMQHKTAEAMTELAGGMHGVMGTIRSVGQLAQDKADQAFDKVDNANQAQSQQQQAMKWMTGVLAVCTFAYTGINGWVAFEMHQGNATQEKVAAAATEQAAAARESNEIQKKSLALDSKRVEVENAIAELKRREEIGTPKNGIVNNPKH